MTKLTEDMSDEEYSKEYDKRLNNIVKELDELVSELWEVHENRVCFRDIRQYCFEQVLWDVQCVCYEKELIYSKH